MSIPTLPPNTLVLANVQKAIYDWIKNELVGVIPPEQIIWRQQSEALPPRPCVTMKITDGPKRVGFLDSVMYSRGNQFVIGGQRTMTVSIQVFGNTQVNRPMAYQTAIDLNSSLSKLTVLDFLRGQGVSIQGQGDPLNITALEETEFEERAQFDVLMGLAQNVTDDPSYIAEIHGEGEIDTTSAPINVTS